MKTRDEIIAELKQLPEPKAPTGLAPGAGPMCYQRVVMSSTHQYVCPTCGARTHFVAGEGGAKGLDRLLGRSREVPAYCGDTLRTIDENRRLFREIQGLPVELDESEFCRKCCPNPPEPCPRLGLVVRWSGRAEHRVFGIVGSDIKLLRELSDGTGNTSGGSARMWLTKAHVARFKELLGIGSDEV